MIELKHISKTFNRNSPNAVLALTDVNLVIPEKSFVVVVGSNGSGKSTLLNAIAGTVRIDEGQIVVNGSDITRLADYRRSKLIARIFQNPLTGTSSDLTILENFRLAALRSQTKKFHIGTGEKFIQTVKEKIYMLGLGLEDKLELTMGSLSGGQRQALTLLMAIMPGQSGAEENKILLMDEPTAALDPRTSELILKLANRIIREYNLTVMFVTHQLKDALQHGNRIICMEAGKIKYDLAEGVKEKLSINDVYQWFE
ncbi:MAG: ATP-binding cassette domain-containing protein [Bacteroidota bacterium]